MQRKAAKEATVILVDEVEHGLEPHRIRRLLHSLGAKEKAPPLQGFLTTHSPVVLREMFAEQVTLLRRHDDKHTGLLVGSKPDAQGTLRRFPEAFLAAAVLVCEGASEVGLVRGLDQHHTAIGETSLSALGVELVDAGGCDHLYLRADVFRSLGYRVTVLRDDDRKPNAAVEATFTEGAGSIHKWRDGWTLEDELFDALPNKAITALLDYAIQLHGKDLVNNHIKSTSNGKIDLPTCQGGITPAVRAALAKACATKAAPWFKNVTATECIGREIIGPMYKQCDQEFSKILDGSFAWIAHA